MIKNYLKTAFRSLFRNMQFTAINILGLALGLAACLLMTGYVIHELSYESRHVHKDRIFRVNGRFSMGGGSVNNAAVVAPLGPAIKESLPEVEEAVRIAGKYDLTLTAGDAGFKEKKVYFTEPQAFAVFTFPLVRGNPQKALEAPFSLVIDEFLAHKYFGNEDPIGRTIKIGLDEPREFQVTGVMKTMPTNTVLNVRMLASFSTLDKLAGDQLCQNLNNWRAFGLYYTFLRLRPGADAKAVEAKIAALTKAAMGEEAKSLVFYLQPLKAIYLQTNKNSISNDFSYSGNPTRVLIFATIAFLILLLACINFVNLSMARIFQRLKDVGVRKTCGASRPKLLAQFLTESLLLTAAAMFIGVLLFQIIRLPLDAFLGEQLAFGLADSPALLAVLGGLVIVVGILAGSYPGLALARIPVISILRSRGSLFSSKSTLRRTLVVFQFFIAIGLVACTLGIVEQIRFAVNRDPGFNKENLIALQAPERKGAPRMKVLQTILLAQPAVVEASLISAVPAGQNRWMTSMKPTGEQDDKQRMIQLIMGDPRFLPAFGIKLVQGRNFEEGREADRTAVLLNETAVKAFGLRKPVGSRLLQGESNLEVIGVVRDFNTNSIHSRIYPVAILPAIYDLSTLSVRVAPGNESAAIAGMQSAWNEVFPASPFSYASVAETVDRAYDNERKLASLLFSFCGLAAFIAALGVFGLSAFIGEQRTKEVGVRKVLGAKVSQIVFLLTKSFFRWVLAASLLAWPVAYFALGKWLQSFAFRTPVEVWPFLASGFLALAIALLTVCYQAVKTALANPVESLKYE